jgi:hypothetical protein
MKRLLLIVLPLLLMVGCEDKKNDTTEPVNPLIGVYNLTSVSVSIQSNPVQTLTFNHDGSNTYLVFILGDAAVYSLQGKIDGDDGSEGGTWSDTGNKLTLIPSDGDTEIWDFTLSGNNLVMTMSEPETDTTWGISMTYNFTKE